MKRFIRIIAVIVLLASLVLLFDKLFTPQPIEIILQSGQEVTTQTSDYFTLTETILLLVCSFLIGTAATYLFYNSNEKKPEKEEAAEHLMKTKSIVPEAIAQDKYDIVLPLLSDAEKRVMILLKEAQGEIPQNKLVLKLNFSKVKVTRILRSLELKNLIRKERMGLTNNIKVIK